MLLKFFTISKFHENTMPFKPDSPAMLLNLYFLVFGSVTSVDFFLLCPGTVLIHRWIWHDFEAYRNSIFCKENIYKYTNVL